MSGETNLKELLKNINPILNKGEYVFCTIGDISSIKSADIIGFFREKEGITIILEKTMAVAAKINYSFTSSWITLSVHSSLEAIG